jgi:hypothetical protein
MQMICKIHTLRDLCHREHLKKSFNGGVYFSNFAPWYISLPEFHQSITFIECLFFGIFKVPIYSQISRNRCKAYISTSALSLVVCFRHEMLSVGMSLSVYLCSSSVRARIWYYITVKKTASFKANENLEWTYISATVHVKLVQKQSYCTGCALQ